MPPSAEGVRVVAELVTDAAIDAASEAVFANRGLSNDPLIPVLNAAAPHIAAEALRQARNEIDKRYPVSGEGDWVATAMAALDDLADELEGE